MALGFDSKQKKKWDFLWVGTPLRTASLFVIGHPIRSRSAGIFTGKTSLLASYAQRNQLLAADTRPRWPHGHWPVCLPIHLA
jgi:hypothetical protein